MAVFSSSGLVFLNVEAWSGITIKYLAREQYWVREYLLNYLWCPLLPRRFSPHPLSHTTSPSHGHNRHIHAADLILAEFNLVNIWLDNRGSFVILKGLQAFSHSLWPHSTSLPITGSQDQRRTGSRKLLQRMRKNQPCCIILTCELSYCPASPGPPDGICRTQNWYCSFELLLF